MKKSFGKKLVALALAGMLSFGAVPQEALSKLVGDTIAKFLYIVPQSTLMNAQADETNSIYINYSWNDDHTEVTAIEMHYHYDDNSGVHTYNVPTGRKETTDNINCSYVKEPTCDDKGTGYFTAVFEAEPEAAFSVAFSAGSFEGCTEVEESVATTAVLEVSFAATAELSFLSSGRVSGLAAGTKYQKGAGIT